MKRIKKFNETNGPAYGKEETTKKGLVFMPLDTDNPTLLVKDEFDDSIPNEDNMLDDNENKIKIKKDKNIEKVKRTKKFKEYIQNKK
jgi:hypothetical protein